MPQMMPINWFFFFFFFCCIFLLFNILNYYISFNINFKLNKKFFYKKNKSNWKW